MGKFGTPNRWQQFNRIFGKVIFGLCLILLVLDWGKEAQAGVLAERVASFPQWVSKPTVSAAKGDLIYPDWMAGHWTVSSTLIDLVAPLAPNLVTPGFESNRRYLNQPIRFEVNFQPADRQILKQGWTIDLFRQNSSAIVADRAFNGLRIGRAYLGEANVLAVKVDPHNPNRQITFLKSDRQLISTVTGRGNETPQSHQFVATEIAQQVFQGDSQIYLNEVEITTAYQLLEAEKKIAADQITAIYLSPQDPQYFAAAGRPVALYRYRLELTPISWEISSPEENGV